MILDGYKSNYQTLIDAIKANETALVECVGAITGERVIVVCAVTQIHDEITFVPLAKMFDGNPYEEIIPYFEEETVH